MDGTAKGGIAIALSYQFNLPIRFIGLGEKAEDLVPFNKESFVDAILPD
jgi:fused signal recognition particle receptor